MKFVFMISFFLFVHKIIWASWDIQSSFSARSFPRGASFSTDIGKSFVFWDRREKSLRKFMYGMLRGKIAGSTSVVVNSSEASLELYPISFLAFKIGQQEVWQSFNQFEGVNCLNISCKGKIIKRFVGMKMVLPFKENFIFWDGSLISSKWGSVNTQESFFDSYLNLLISENDENLYSATTLIGRSYNDSISFGLMSIYSSFLKSRKNNHLLASYFSWSKRKLKALLGVGGFKNVKNQVSFSALTRVTWTFNSGNLLF